VDWLFDAGLAEKYAYPTFRWIFSQVSIAYDVTKQGQVQSGAFYNGPAGSYDELDLVKQLVQRAVKNGTQVSATDDGAFRIDYFNNNQFKYAYVSQLGAVAEEVGKATGFANKDSLNKVGFDCNKQYFIYKVDSTLDPSIINSPANYSVRNKSIPVEDIAVNGQTPKGGRPDAASSLVIGSDGSETIRPLGKDTAGSVL